jgi:hypothetical protein
MKTFFNKPKNIFFLIAALMIQLQGISQIDWLKRAGGASPDLANGLWADAAGNVFVSGSISGTAKFHKTVVTSQGGGDICVVKYSSGGNMLWVKTFGGKLDDFATAITGDAQGNLYITGLFSDTAYFDQEELIANGSDLFVAKLSPAGKLEWVRSLQTAGNAIVSAIAVTDEGSAYVGGMYNGNFDNDRVKINQGQTDGFVCKINWQGNRVWTRVFGGLGFDELKVLRTDPWGRVLVGAVFDSFMLVDERELEGKSSRSSAAILYEATGNVLWTSVFTGPDSECSIADAVTDLEGTCYICGKYSGETSFDEVKSQANGQTDVFVTALDKFGKVRWISSLGGSDPDDALVMELLSNGRSLVLAGQFNGLLSHGRKSIKGELDNQFFMARLDNRGNLDELRGLPFNSTFTCEGKKINSQGKLFLSGSFTGKALFGKTPLVSGGEEDMFIGVLSDSKILR